MIYQRLLWIVLVIVCALPQIAHAQGAGAEWNTLNQEANELYRAGRYDRAIVVAKKALEVAESNVGKNHPDVATSLNNLGLSYKTQGNYAKAEPLYKRSLAIWEKALGADHPDVASHIRRLEGAKSQCTCRLRAHHAFGIWSLETKAPHTRDGAGRGS